MGDISVPRMLHGKVLRSPVAHARIVSIDASRGLAMPGVVAVLTGARPAGHRPVLGPRHQGPAHRGHRPGALRGRAGRRGRRGERGDRRGALCGDRGRVRGAARRGHARGGARARAPSVQDGPLRAGLFHGLGTLPERDGNVCYRYGIDRGDVEAAFADADIVVEGDYTFPGVYQYAMETHSVIAQRRAGRHHDVGDLPAPVPGAGRDRRAVRRCPWAGAHRGRPYLGGGFGSKSYTKMEPITVALARKAGRPVKIVNSVAESMVTTRRHGRAAACAPRRRATGRCWAASRHLVRHRRLRRQRPAGDRHRRRRGARPVPLGRRARSMPPASTPTPRRRARTGRSAPRTSSGSGELQVDEVARRAGLDALEIRRDNLLHPGEQVRAGGKPLDADLIGDVEKVAAALGWDAPEATRRRPGRLGGPARGRRPSGLERGRAPGGGRRGAVVLVGSTEMGQGQRTAFAQIAAEVLGDARRTRPRASARTRASRPTTARRAPAAPPRWPGWPSSAPRPRCASDLLEIAATVWPDARDEIELADGAAWCGERAADLPGAHRAALRAVRRPAHRRGRGPPARAPAPTPRGRCSGRSASAPRRSRSTARPARHVTRTATVADVGKAINPQLVERQDEGATMQGIGNALFEEMVFSDGLLLNDDLLEYRDPDHRGPAGRDDVRHRRERRRARALRGQGLRRGRVRGHHRGARDRGRRRGRADARAATHPGARVAADPGTREEEAR